MTVVEGFRTYSGSKNIPSAFEQIREDFQKLKDDRIPILYEDRRGKVVASIVMDLIYVGSHYATGVVTYHHRVDGPERIPYTIHYSDVLCINAAGLDKEHGIGLQDYVDLGLVGVRIVPKGAHPAWLDE